MKMIQCSSQSNAIAEMLAYGSPRPDHNHTIVESVGSYLVLVNHPADMEIESVGEPSTAYTHDDLCIAISEAIGEGMDISLISKRLDVMLDRQ